MSMAERIKRKIEEHFQPERLEIVNESHKHEGHAGHDGSGESHFRVLVVSRRFEGMGRVQRQRMVYDLLRDEFLGGLHALSLRMLTPGEYE